ncbi:MAG: CHAT domain-containing protein [bacterium]
MTPRILLTFANEAATEARYLRALQAEVRALRAALAPAKQAGLCELQVETNASVETLIAALQSARKTKDLAIFHFAGHASGDALSLEGEGASAHAGGLARMLALQPGLRLVVLNGCSTGPQVQRLLDLGVPAVIATSRAIDDAVATRFAASLYSRLAAGETLADAFAATEAAILMEFGEGPTLFRDQERSLRPQANVGTRGFPWALSTAAGAEQVRAWSLPAAANDPLFGLPQPPAEDLPPSPYRHLDRYRREHWEVFFGRSHPIRAVFDALTGEGGPPLVLLYGPSGAGKSSLLEAGVWPRLEQVAEVLVLRRDSSKGLPAMLAEVFGEAGSGDALRQAWIEREAASGRPVVVVLDQLEEALTRPIAGEPDELAHLFGLIADVFRRPADRPRGRLLLTLRAEWMASVQGSLDALNLPVRRIELRHLSAAEAVEVVEGPTRTPALRTFDRLSIDADLPAEIAADVAADGQAAVAPTLAILLTRLWQQAADATPATPAWRLEDYRDLRKRGLLLDDFVRDQLAALAVMGTDWVASGLALDVLEYHTTALGTAQLRPAKSLVARYAHRSDLPELLAACKALRLLSSSTEAADRLPVGEWRLAHDTLAPLVRARFEASQAPGQRARRVLQQRAVDWEGEAVGDALDAVDLAAAERGLAGMRVQTGAEGRLLDASRAAERRRAAAARRARWVRVGAVALLAVAAAIGWTLRRSAVVAADEARRARIAAEGGRYDGLATALAAQALDTVSRGRRADFRAALLAGQAVDFAYQAEELLGRRAEAWPHVESALRRLANEPWLREGVIFEHDDINQIALAPDGRWLAVASGGEGHAARIWDLQQVGAAPRVLPGHGTWLRDIGWAGPERVVVLDGAGAVYFWELGEPSRLVLRVDGPEGRCDVTAFATDPAQGVVVAGQGSWPGCPGAVQAWRWPPGREPERLPLALDVPGPVKAVAISPGGKQLAVAADHRSLLVVPLGGGKATERALPDPVRVGEVPGALAFSPDGRELLVARPGGVALIPLADGPPVILSDGQVLGRMPLCVAFGPLGEVYAAGNGGVIDVWRRDQPLPRLRLPGPELAQPPGVKVRGLEVLPDGDILAAGSEATVWRWHPAGDEPVLVAPGDGSLDESVGRRVRRLGRDGDGGWRVRGRALVAPRR